MTTKRDLKAAHNDEHHSDKALPERQQRSHETPPRPPRPRFLIHSQHGRTPA